MSNSPDASPFSARGRKPHLAESVRRYASSSSRRPERHANTKEALSEQKGAEKSSSPAPRVRVVQPKSMETCGACRLELPEDLASNLAKEVKKQVMDMADLMINPLGAGPFQLATALEQKRSKQLEDLDRVDRLWEFRLCVEMLRDCLDSFSTHGERDLLSTADETLLSAEDLLRRITELAVMHNNSGDALLDSISHGSVGTFASQEDAGLLMQVLQSPDFREKGGLTSSLLSSRLMISGLLESVLGELTCWRSHPSEADLQAWKRWDRSYELLARRVAAVQQSQHVGSKSSVGSIDADLRRRCMEGASRCAGDEVVECVACRPACTPLCGYGRA